MFHCRITRRANTYLQKLSPRTALGYKLLKLDSSPKCMDTSENIGFTAATARWNCTEQSEKLHHRNLTVYCGQVRPPASHLCPTQPWFKKKCDCFSTFKCIFQPTVFLPGYLIKPLEHLKLQFNFQENIIYLRSDNASANKGILTDFQRKKPYKLHRWMPTAHHL